MGKDTEVIVHGDTGSDTSIFYKLGYAEGQCSTLPTIGYPLPSLYASVFPSPPLPHLQDQETFLFRQHKRSWEHFFLVNSLGNIWLRGNSPHQTSHQNWAPPPLPKFFSTTSFNQSPLPPSTTPIAHKSFQHKDTNLAVVLIDNLVEWVCHVPLGHLFWVKASCIGVLSKVTSRAWRQVITYMKQQNMSFCVVWKQVPQLISFQSFTRNSSSEP